jgi:hypothetical protein
MGGNGHIHPLGVEILGEDDGLPGAEMHANPASLAKLLINKNLVTFHPRLLIFTTKTKLQHCLRLLNVVKTMEPPAKLANQQ